MKKAILLFLTLTYFTNYAQTKFEKGYFINNSGERIECFIKNLDLLNNPKDFTYKLSETSKPYKATIHDVKVFEIYDIVKYERHTVDIDRSSEIEDEISTNRKVVFNKENLLLKVLVEGKATLYQYTETNLNRFFYRYQNSNIEQLVFKSYSNGFDNAIKKNERYKQQLLNDLTCEELNSRNFSNLKYKKDKLVKLFVNYNKCVNAEYTDYGLKELKNSKIKINLNLTSGINLSSLYIIHGGFIQSGKYNFEDKTTFRIGIEAEFVMGFNNNKWAFIIEPNYVFYSSTFTDEQERLNNFDFSATVDYKSIELPFGVRHYFFLNNKSKLFLNALVVQNFALKSEIKSISALGPDALNFEGKTSLNLGFGVGYRINNKFSCELRTYNSRNILGNYINREGDLNIFSVIIGYTIF